jgi:hypothetical protein
MPWTPLCEQIYEEARRLKMGSEGWDGFAALLRDKVGVLEERLQGWDYVKGQIDKALEGKAEDISVSLTNDGCFSWATHVVERIKALSSEDAEE